VVLVLVVAAVALAVLAWERLESSPPGVTGPEAILIGREATEVRLTVREEGMGLKRITATLVDPSGEKPLLDDAIRGDWMEGSSEREREIALRLDPGELGLEEGEALLRIHAEDWSWRGNRGELVIPIEVDRTPPRVAVRSGLTYVDQGGSAAVVYELSGDAARDGVEVVGEHGSVFYPGYPFPGSDPGASPATEAGAEAGTETEAGSPAPSRRPIPDRGRRRIAIFAVDRDAGGDASIVVVAADRAGNESRAGWNVVLRPRVFPSGDVTLPASFLRDVVPSLAQAEGIDATDPVRAFEQINTQMRAANERTIREQLVISVPRPLWSGGFLQLANSKVTSRFAEARVYRVDGRPISSAVHYGYDLASLSGATVPAANAGVVRYAGDLGIYGQCVLVDHGLGVASLYGHLSSLEVREGDEVAKGQGLGSSGATGLAGGDHLHFAILVGPTYVDPIEWWDPKWVREHVMVKLEP
jgi:murein DD-endopeptidase MepM/ murein hydrolase activator NlpD